MLAPWPLGVFFERFFDREPLHVERNDPTHFAAAYSVAELEDTLATGSSDVEKFSLVRTGSPGAAVADFTTLRGTGFAGGKPLPAIDPRKVVALFADGYTLIIKDAGAFSAGVQRFCTALQRDLSAYAQANVYFTPPRSQGFDVHYDTHDTLTIQIEGEKTWRVYDPLVALPLETQPFKSVDPAALHLNREVTLKPGDTLYLPRGFLHEAKAAQTRSLHITFALAPVRMLEILEILLRMAGDADVRFRRALAPGWSDDPNFGHEIAGLLQAQQAQSTPERIELAREVALNALHALARTSARGGFDGLPEAAAPPDAAIVRPRGDIPLTVRRRRVTVDVLAPGRSFSFPPFCLRALEQITSGAIRYGDIDPALAPENRWLVVRKLALEGVLDLDAH